MVRGLLQTPQPRTRTVKQPTCKDSQSNSQKLQSHALGGWEGERGVGVRLTGCFWSVVFPESLRVHDHVEACYHEP